MALVEPLGITALCVLHQFSGAAVHMFICCSMETLPSLRSADKGGLGARVSVIVGGLVVRPQLSDIYKCLLWGKTIAVRTLFNFKPLCIALQSYRLHTRYFGLRWSTLGFFIFFLLSSTDKTSFSLGFGFESFGGDY